MSKLSIDPVILPYDYSLIATCSTHPNPGYRVLYRLCVCGVCGVCGKIKLTIAPPTNFKISLRGDLTSPGENEVRGGANARMLPQCRNGVFNILWYKPGYTIITGRGHFN